VLPDETPDLRSDEAPQRVPSLSERVRERWRVPVANEDTRDHPVKGPRSPWREDLPSPRCVLEDYRAGAAHYGEGAWLYAAAYWLIAALPLAFNKACAAGHIASQRPGRWWVFCVLVPGLFIICLLAVS
jgi:hypothetical protein